MTSLDVFEAKAHLSALLDRVAQGEAVIIVRDGRPVARLVPAGGADDMARTDRAIDALKLLRQGVTLGGLAWRELRDEGRR